MLEISILVFVFPAPAPVVNREHRVHNLQSPDEERREGTPRAELLSPASQDTYLAPLNTYTVLTMWWKKLTWKIYEKD